MLRTTLFIVVALLTTSPAFAQQAKPGEAAKQSFDQLRTQWHELASQMQEKAKALAAPGADHAAIEKDLAAMQKQSDEFVGKIVASGLEAYQSDPNAYPTVNDTLAAVAGFYVTGDANGDGGDQYERALPIIKALLDKGAGAKWPDLWVWGGVSAYCTNDFARAEQYLKNASTTGAFKNAQSGNPRDPNMRVRQYALGCLEGLDSLKRAWQKEEKIRAAEKTADDLPRVKLTTTRGDIVIELFENEAPQSVANFLTLAKQGYYTNVPFHRVLPSFMAQGGDPTGTGSGGPGYTIRDEQALPNHRQHFRGSLSMANTGRPNSGGSQFFLTFVPTSYLDGRHAVFGRVIEGMDIAASLRRRDPDRGGPGDKILSATVIRDRGHEYKFDKIPE